MMNWATVFREVGRIRSRDFPERRANPASAVHELRSGADRAKLESKVVRGSINYGVSSPRGKNNKK